MSIILFSRPVHSGKTTELLKWCEQKKNIYGILMPDINGRRKILDIRTKELFDIECADAENAKEPITSVGKFYFYTAAFEKANSILLDALTCEPGWMIIDEAGKLELGGKGFYDALEKIVKVYNNKRNNSNLLITVRDNLCEDVISFFKIKDPTVIHQLVDLS